MKRKTGSDSYSSQAPFSVSSRVSLPPRKNFREYLPAKTFRLKTFGKVSGKASGKTSGKTSGKASGLTTFRDDNAVSPAKNSGLTTFRGDIAVSPAKILRTNNVYGQ